MSLRTRRILAFAAIGLIVFAAGAGAIWYFMWRPVRFVDPVEGFSIRFTAEWLVQGTGEGANVRAARELGVAEGGGTGVINVFVAPIENIPTGAAYRDWIMRLNAKHYSKLAKISEGVRNCPAGEAPWSLFVYESNDKLKTRVQVMQVYFVRNSKGYILSCTALPSVFERFRPDFEEAVDSFRFEEPRASGTPRTTP